MKFPSHAGIRAGFNLIRAAPLLLYDGECGLCDAIVRWLLRRAEERGVALDFAELQGETARVVLREAGLARTQTDAAAFDSLVFVPARNGRAHADVFLRTDAVARVLETIGGDYGVLARMLRVFPRGWRDLGYRYVARARHGIWGRLKANEAVAAQDWAQRTRRFLP